MLVYSFRRMSIVVYVVVVVYFVVYVVVFVVDRVGEGLMRSFFRLLFDG